MAKTTTETYVRAIMLDATILSSLTRTAVDAIDQARAGWPTSVPGASPLPGSVRVLEFDGDGNPMNDKYSATERAALNRDPAEADLKALNAAVKAASAHLRLAAILARKWAPMGSTTPDAGVWCDNCAEHGHKNTRRPGGRLCEYCSGFQSRWKQPAPKEALDLKVTKGRVFDADERRILAKQRDARNVAS